MALTQAQQDFVKQGGVIQSSDPNVMADYSSFVRGGSSNSITPATLIPTSALKLPTSPQEPDYLSTLNSIPPDNLLGISGEPTKTETIPSEIQKRLLELTGEIGGQKEAQFKAEETVGLPDFRKQLGDISGQIQSLQKEALAIPLQIQEEFKGRGVTKAGVAPIEIGRLRENAIKSLGLSAIAQTLQGNVALAQQQADKAVELEFAPKQAQLDFLKLAHEMNKDTLNREDAKRSKALEIQLAERQRVLDKEKEDKDKIYTIRLEAARSGADSETIRQLQTAKTPERALQVASYSLGESFRREIEDKQFIRDLQEATFNLSIDKFNEDKRQFNNNYALKEQEIANEKLKELQGKNPVLAAEVTSEVLQNKISLIDSLLGHRGLNKAVGPSFLGRITPFKIDVLSGDVQDFSAGVAQLVNKETIDTLINLKARGGTLGALSDQERILLQSAATKIGSWERVDDEG